MLLHNGSIAATGAPREVLTEYLAGDQGEFREWRPDTCRDTPFAFNAVRVETNVGGVARPISYADAIHFVFDYSIQGDLPPGRIGIQLINQEGITVLTSANTDTSTSLRQAWRRGRTVERCTLPGRLLAPGRYNLRFSQPLADGSDLIHENLIAFKVDDFGSPAVRDGRVGVLAPTLEWRSE